MKKIIAAFAFALSVPPGAVGANPPLEPAPPPDWLSLNRVQVHVPLIQWHRDVPGAATLIDGGLGTALRAMGAGAFTRHAKTSFEDPWWPSAVPRTADGSSALAGPRRNRGLAMGPGENRIAPMIAEARAFGLRMVAYYWDRSDARMEALHPEWACRDRKGRLSRHKVKETNLDLTGPYGQVVEARLGELRAMGADGVYLDGRHLPIGGCFGSTLERDFRAATGRDASRDIPGFLAFQGRRLTETMQRITGPLRADPSFAAIVAVPELAGMLNPAIRLDLARTGVPKNEFHGATAPVMFRQLFRNANRTRNLLRRAGREDLAAGFDRLRATPEALSGMSWSTLRDLSNAPPHIWVFDPRGPQEAWAMAGAVLVHGGIANMHAAPALIARMPGQEAMYDAYARTLDAGRRLSPLLHGSAPDTRVALHLSEDVRDAYRNDAMAWLEVVGPLGLAYEALASRGIGATVIDDRMLAEGDLSQFALLLSPTLDRLDAAGSANLSRHAGLQVAALPPLTAPGVADDPQVAYERIVSPYVPMLEAKGWAVPEGRLPSGALMTQRDALGAPWQIIGVTNAFTYGGPSRKATRPAPPPLHNLRIRLPALAGNVCARNALTGAALPVDGASTLQLGTIESWAMLVWGPCASLPR